MRESLKIYDKEPTVIDEDNNGVILSATGTSNNPTSKHYRVAQASLKQLQDDRVIRFNKVESKLNPRDFFTKAQEPPQ